MTMLAPLSATNFYHGIDGNSGDRLVGFISSASMTSSGRRRRRRRSSISVGGGGAASSSFFPALSSTSSSPSTLFLFLVFIATSRVSRCCGFVIPATTTTTEPRLPAFRRSRSAAAASAGSDGGSKLPGWEDPGRSGDKDKKKDKGGYKFGDFTKNLVGAAIGGNVSKMTGKPYVFGDLSRTIDQSIKDKVNDLTGNDDYEFGDLSKWVDARVKKSANEFTGNETYRFGDLTKEIARKVATGQYTLDDLFLLLKVFVTFQATISPVAAFLPVKLLVEMLNFSIANDVGGRVASGLAMELDRRIKKSILGDAEYKLGDGTKRAVSGAVERFTGQETYTFGDVTKTVVSQFANGDKTGAGTTSASSAVDSGGGKKLIGGATSSSSNIVDAEVIEALDQWDASSEESLKGNLAAFETYVDEVEKVGGKEERR